MTELFQKQVEFLKRKIGEGMKEINNWPLRTQYMTIRHDGNFDVNMISSEVVRARHHMHKCLRIYLVLKIKLNTGQTLGITDNREGIKIWLSLRGPILTVILKFFSEYRKNHNGGQTWHILHYLIILSVK